MSSGSQVESIRVAVRTGGKPKAEGRTEVGAVGQGSGVFYYLLLLFGVER